MKNHSQEKKDRTLRSGGLSGDLRSSVKGSRTQNNMLSKTDTHLDTNIQNEKQF